MGYINTINSRDNASHKGVFQSASLTLVIILVEKEVIHTWSECIFSFSGWSIIIIKAACTTIAKISILSKYTSHRCNLS